MKIIKKQNNSMNFAKWMCKTIKSNHYTDDDAMSRAFEKFIDKNFYK